MSSVDRGREAWRVKRDKSLIILVEMYLAKLSSSCDRASFQAWQSPAIKTPP